MAASARCSASWAGSSGRGGKIVLEVDTVVRWHAQGSWLARGSLRKLLTRCQFQAVARKLFTRFFKLCASTHLPPYTRHFIQYALRPGCSDPCTRVHAVSAIAHPSSVLFALPFVNSSAEPDLEIGTPIYPESPADSIVHETDHSRLTIEHTTKLNRLSQDSDDSLSSSPIELPLPPLPGQQSKARGGSTRVPAEFDFGSSPSQFTAPSQARRTPSPPVPSLVTGNTALTDAWHDERTPTAPHQPSESSYYTALWGSPYERNTGSIAGSKRTRLSRHRGTFSSEDSPGRSLLRPILPPSASEAEDIPEEDQLDDLDERLRPRAPDFGTSRFRGKRTEDWLRAHIAHRRRGEKQNWWSDESGEGSDADQADSKPRKRRGRKSEFDDTWLQLREEPARSRSRAESSQQGSIRRPPRVLSGRLHRAAPSDATLTQAQFDELVAGEFDDLPDINMLAAMSQQIQGMIPRRGGSRSQSRDLSNADKPLPPAPLERTASESPVIDSTIAKRPSASTAPSFSRPKKKVAWRGKNCVIALPLEEGKDENGKKKRYLSSEETASLLRKWEDKGYSTRGFDLINDTNTYKDVRGQSAEIYEWPRPDVGNRSFNVAIPNRSAWENYVRELQEAKLRALGVLKDRPEESARQSPAPSQVQMSRQPSSQTSRAPTASANGFRGAFGEGPFPPSSFTSPDGIQSRQSMISPANHPGGFHAPKQSIAFIPGQGFVNMQFPQPQPTPPPMLAQQLLSSQPSSRGPSPAVMDGRRMSILTPQPQSLRHQHQPSMLQPPRPELQRAISGHADDHNAPAVYSQPAQIASPMPQGHSHRHNVSESLQREIDEAEYHLEESIRKQLEDDDEQIQRRTNGRNGSHSPAVDSPAVDGDANEPGPGVAKIEADLQTNPSLANSPSPGPDAAPAPKSKPIPPMTAPRTHAKKASTSKLRADVPAFVFDPTKSSFTPSGVFNFGQPSPQPVTQPPPQQPQTTPFQFGAKRTPGHSKNSSITSTLNVTAPAFVPSGNTHMKFQIPTEQSTDFSFSSAVPGIKPNARSFNPGSSVGSSGSGPGSEAGSTRPHSRVFSHFNLDEVVKPDKKSKAIPIVKPKTPTLEQPKNNELEFEDNEGRPARDDARSKKARKGDDEGDTVPQFATPTPEPAPSEQLKIALAQVKAATPEPEPLQVPQEHILKSLPTPPSERVEEAEDETKDIAPPMLQPEETKAETTAEPVDPGRHEEAENPMSIPDQVEKASIPHSAEDAKSQADTAPTVARTETPAKPVQTPSSPSEQLRSELKMPKVDTEVANMVPERKESIVDWAETPLEGPFSRQSLEAAFNKNRQSSIVEEPQVEASAEAQKVERPTATIEPPQPVLKPTPVKPEPVKTSPVKMAPSETTFTNAPVPAKSPKPAEVEKLIDFDAPASISMSQSGTPNSSIEGTPRDAAAKPTVFNPAASAFNFNPAASTFNFDPAVSTFTFGQTASQGPPTGSNKLAAAPPPETSFQDAAPEQEWPEKRERVKAPPKLGLERKTSLPKGGLAGGLLGASRWAQPETAAPAPAKESPKIPPSSKDSSRLPTRENSPPASRGRKTRTRDPSPPLPQIRAPARDPSPEYREARKGFHFTTFGDKLAAARKAEPPRELSPPVRGRGKKGSATNALSRSPSPDYKHMGKGFNFSTYREHEFATPSSPPPPPPPPPAKSPSLANSPPPATPSPPPIPERSPSRRREQGSVPQLPPVITDPKFEIPPRSPSLANSPSPARSPSPELLRPQPLNIEQRIRDGVSYVQPSPTYQEIDEVIKHLNGSDSDRGVERTPLVLSRAGSQVRSKGPSPEQLISLSPVLDDPRSTIVQPTSDPNDLKRPFQYLPEQDYGSSASAKAAFVTQNPRLSPSFKPSRREQDEMSPSRRMGHIAHRDSVSDWNDVLSSSDEAKFHARTHFFDNKIGEVIGNVVQTRNRPLEQALAQLSKNFEQFQHQVQNERHESRRSRRSASDKPHSDADDEDDEVQRGMSPVKDRKFEKLKHAVLEAVSAQQKASVPGLEQLVQTVAELRTQLQEQAAKPSNTKEIDAVIEQSITRHMRGKSAAVMGNQEAAGAEKLQLQISGLESMLKAAEQRASDEEKSRQMAEEAVQGNQKLLRAAMEEADQHKEAAQETEHSLRSFLDAQQESKQRMAMLEEAEEAMQSKILNLQDKNEALEETLEEYRLTHAQLKKDIDDERHAKSELGNALEAMQSEKQQLHEEQQRAKESFEAEKQHMRAETHRAVDSLRREIQQMNEDWNKDMADGRAEIEEREGTINNLRSQLDEGSHSQRILKERVDKIREEMAEAAKTLAKDQSNWRQKEEEHNAKNELLSARMEAEARTRERLELEIDRLEKGEKEAMRAKFLVEQIRTENVNLGGLVNEVQRKHHDALDAAQEARRQVEEVKQRAQTEITRMNKLMNTEAESQRSQAAIVRQDLQAVIGRLEQELMNTRQEVDSAKHRNKSLYEETTKAKEHAHAEAAHDKSAALQEQREYHERVVSEEKERHSAALAAAATEHQRAIEATAEEHRRALNELHERQRREVEDLQLEHDRSMRYANDDHKRLLDSAMEDKRMTENYLQGRLSLADEKAAHYTERIDHLEERLEIAKSAAAAAADAAKAAKKDVSVASPLSSHGPRPSLSFHGGSNVPEKISPQALRESIAVLQEQLHERETKVEKLEQELEPLRDLPQTVKEKDMEITFVRELLDVRMDDLQDIIRILSQPQGFSRQRVRDAVIRLRANLQMEQQEKERQLAHAKDPNVAPQQAGLSLSNLRDVTSSPRNIGLAAAAAWGNWRRGQAPLSSLAEMAAPAAAASSSDNVSSTSQTPGRGSPSSFLSGLLTPPATNLKPQTPTPANRAGMSSRRTSTATSRGGVRPLANYSTPKHQQRPSLARGGTEDRHMMLSELPQPDTPPGLLNKGNYDQDADEAGAYSLDRYVNEHDDDELEGTGGEVFEDNSRMEAEVSHEAIGVVDEPFGNIVGA